MNTLLERYTKKTLKLLNDSLEWNTIMLPDNTFELQLQKFEEEFDEVYSAETYEDMVSELGDVLIVIGGMARFSDEIAAAMFSEFIMAMDCVLYMEVVDQATKKMPILYKRTYSDGYKHDN